MEDLIVKMLEAMVAVSDADGNWSAKRDVIEQFCRDSSAYATAWEEVTSWALEDE